MDADERGSRRWSQTALATAMVMASSEGMAAVAADGTVLLANPAAELLVGPLLLGRPIGRVRGLAPLEATLQALATGGGSWVEPPALRVELARDRVVEVTVARLRPGDPAGGFLLSLREDPRARTALQDAFTGLLNRRALLAQMEMLAERGGGVVASLDIDGLKLVNDQHGHPVGDEVITHVAGVLATMVLKPGVAARVGGDEFVILLPGMTLTDAEPVLRASAPPSDSHCLSARRGSRAAPAGRPAAGVGVGRGRRADRGPVPRPRADARRPGPAHGQIPWRVHPHPRRPRRAGLGPGPHLPDDLGPRPARRERPAAHRNSHRRPDRVAQPPRPGRRRSPAGRRPVPGGGPVPRPRRVRRLQPPLRRHRRRHLPQSRRHHPRRRPTRPGPGVPQRRRGVRRPAPRSGHPHRPGHRRTATGSQSKPWPSSTPATNPASSPSPSQSRPPTKRLPPPTPANGPPPPCTAPNSATNATEYTPPTPELPSPDPGVRVASS